MFGKVKSGQNKKRNNEDSLLSAAIQANKTVTADAALQDRVTAYFANGNNTEVLTAEAVQVTPEQRESVQGQLASGQIAARDLDSFLIQISSPLQDNATSTGQIFQRIVESPKQKQILAVAMGYNANNWQNVSEEDLKHLLAAPLKGQPDYQTPVGFATFRKKFIDGITAQATPEQLADYNQAMDDLEANLYGRRFDYYQQAMLMAGKELALKQAESNEEADLQEIIAEETKGKKRKANAAGAESAGNEATGAAMAGVAGVAAESVAGVVAGMTGVGVEGVSGAVGAGVGGVTGMPSGAGGAAESLSTNIPGVNAIGPEKSNEILNRAIINGDPWKQGGNEYRLGITNLLSSGLTPAYEMTLENQDIVFSAPFQLSDGRGAILAYVVTPGGAKVRAYYLNTKTGMWHYAPDIVRGAHGEGLGQIGEAYGATSTMLPVTLQDVLSDMVKNYGFREITMVNPDFLFAGTAMAYNTQQEYRETLAKGQMRGDFYQEVDKNPIHQNWQMVGKNKNVPQLISVNANLAPNFAQATARFTTYSILTGQVGADAFVSKDTQAIWLFCSDEWGRAWLGNIEIVSPLTSTGCRRDWMTAGDLATPIYEYSTQAAGYGDPSDTRKGLVGMWNQYLSKIPLLQEYIGWRNRVNQA